MITYEDGRIKLEDDDFCIEKVCGYNGGIYTTDTVYYLANFTFLMAPGPDDEVVGVAFPESKEQLISTKFERFAIVPSIGLFGITHYDSETGEPHYIMIKPDPDYITKHQDYMYKYLKCIPDADIAMDYINLLRNMIDVKIHKETGEVICDEKVYSPDSDMYKKIELFKKIF